MGWTYYWREPGESDRDHFQREVLGDRYRILDCASKDGVFYAAVETLEDGGPSDRGQVWAFVALFNRGRGSDGFNFGYKDMEESMGPAVYGCPDRILDLLTPVEELYGPVPEYESVGRFSGALWAIQWRSECRALNARRAARPSVSKGDTVRFSRAVNFTNGARSDTFTLVDGKRNRWRSEPSGLMVRLPRRDRWPDYELVE